MKPSGVAQRKGPLHRIQKNFRIGPNVVHRTTECRYCDLRIAGSGAWEGLGLRGQWPLPKPKDIPSHAHLK